MRQRAMAAAVAVLLASVVLASAARIGRDSGHHQAAATGSATRLGPHDGELVSQYLARARATLSRHDQAPTYALVALDTYLAADQLPRALAGTPLVRVLVRVPLPRVQTRLFDIPARTPADITGGMGVAARDLDAEARADTARQDVVAAAVAHAQADALRDQCACVLGAVVHARPDALAGLADQPRVRAVELAPAGEPLARLAFAPLLPEQKTRVEPPPDDGAAALVSPSARPAPDRPPAAGAGR